MMGRLQRALSTIIFDGAAYFRYSWDVYHEILLRLRDDNGDVINPDNFTVARVWFVFRCIDLAG